MFQNNFRQAAKFGTFKNGICISCFPIQFLVFRQGYLIGIMGREYVSGFSVA